MTRWKQQESHIDRFFSLFKCTRIFFFFPPHSFYMKKTIGKNDRYTAQDIRFFFSLSLTQIEVKHWLGCQGLKTEFHIGSSYMICELTIVMSIVFLTRTEGSTQHYVHILKEKWNVKKKEKTTCKSYINVSYTPWVWELHTSIHNIKFIRHQKHWFFVNVFTRTPATTEITVLSKSLSI